MSTLSRLLLFVEGQGDRDALPVLVAKLMDEISARNHLFLDGDPFVVGHVAGLTKDNGSEWVRFLKAAKKKSNLGGVLLLLDGDEASIRKEVFCARVFAMRLAEQAKHVGAGYLISA